MIKFSKGIGAGRGANINTLKRIGLAWVTTIPCALVIGATVVQIARMPEPGGLILFCVLILLELCWGIYITMSARSVKDITARLTKQPLVEEQTPLLEEQTPLLGGTEAQSPSVNKTNNASSTKV